MIARLDSPSRSDLNFLKEWMTSTNMGNIFLLGRDADVWEKYDIYRPDLIALRARETGDPFSRFLSSVLIHWYHRLFGRYIRVR
jgi:hypothetical protein